MKLRNKKTGEILDFNAVIHELNMFGSLAELNEEWEDYKKEPKDYWFVDNCGVVDIDEDVGADIDRQRKEIGNYFETEEEAEKAVEKLKAWKRLRDNVLKITGYGKYTYDPKSIHHINITFDYVSDEDRKNLDLLFGGEE